ncbi:hypothetical protein B0H14DRAFT_2624327 [Mycena olivaceomarginata]|nr:hypothetical protein B0H14DRAFT_2624327 [Mycena olivaceomarginata]
MCKVRVWIALNLGQNNILPEHPITLRYTSEMWSTIHRSRQAIDAVEWNTAYCRMSKMIRGFWAAHAVKKRRSLRCIEAPFGGGPWGILPAPVPATLCNLKPFYKKLAFGDWNNISIRSSSLVLALRCRFTLQRSENLRVLYAMHMMAFTPLWRHFRIEKRCAAVNEILGPDSATARKQDLRPVGRTCTRHMYIFSAGFASVDDLDLRDH